MLVSLVYYMLLLLLVIITSIVSCQCDYSVSKCHYCHHLLVSLVSSHHVCHYMAVSNCHHVSVSLSLPNGGVTTISILMSIVPSYTSVTLSITRYDVNVINSSVGVTGITASQCRCHSNYVTCVVFRHGEDGGVEVESGG